MTTPPPCGLTEQEAARRLAAQPRRRRPASSRSYASIVRANVLTVFNAILVTFGVVTLIYADWRDALFLGVLVANAAIGIGQEVRAKRALDRLAALVVPDALVLRDGTTRRVPVEEVVTGDVVRAQAGDQFVADGTLLTSGGLRVDESILTGESEPVARRQGEQVRSGSFAVEGAGEYVVEAVGHESYAEQVAGEARRFRHPRSPLERAFNRLLLALVAGMLPLAGILGFSLWQRSPDVAEAVSTSAAAVVSLIPEGLILLMSLTFAVAALRLARRGAYAQQLNAIESLASVDVICLDKTGTLTDGTLRVVETVAADGVTRDDAQATLGRFAAAMPAHNLTLAAIAAAHPAVAEAATGIVGFSSRRRWSAVGLHDGTLVLGAPERFDLGPLGATVAEHTAAGRRVLAFGRSDAPLDSDVDADAGPPPTATLGVVVLSERLRDSTRETVAFLRAENVELRVISGDAPATVAAIAADAGIEVINPLDGACLRLDDPAALREQIAQTTVIGRIAPEGKRALVQDLVEQGRYVAMIGDGVNDVPALKQARLAIVPGSGAQMARSVADVVLISGDFAALPGMVDEGRKILRNLQRVAKLYVSKSAFAAFLILTVGTTAQAYPLLPRHLSLIATLTIGVPTFFLALAQSSGPWRPQSFLRDVAAFAIPAGTAAGVGVVAGYQFGLHTLELGVGPARTIAATVLAIVGLYLVIALEATESGRTRWVWPLCAALAVAYAAALAFPPTRTFFALSAPTLPIILTSLAGAAIAVIGLRLGGFAGTAPSGAPGHQTAER